MIDMSGPRSITAPRRKLRRVAKVWRAPAHRHSISAPNADLRHVRLPDPAVWRDILRNGLVSNVTFGDQAKFSYLLDEQLTTSQARGWPREQEVPLEERVLLMMVLALAGAYLGEPASGMPMGGPFVDGPYPI